MRSYTLANLTIVLTTSSVINSQEFSISDSLNAFGLSLLKETNSQAGDSLNVALSTYTVWTLLATIAEGSMDNTARQLENTLRIPQNKNVLRTSFQNYSSIFTNNTNNVGLELSTAIFTNEDYPVKKHFQTIIEQYYKVPVHPLNFKNPDQAATLINNYAAQATRNRIRLLVSPEDVTDAQVFLTTLLFFKGQWKMPFNRSGTRKESFYDEKNVTIGEVDMMFQVAPFPYSRMENIMAYAVELPYGLDRKMSMIIILPFKGESLAGVLNLMSNMPFSSIMQYLEDAEEEFVDEDIQVHLPKFKISSDFNLNIILEKIGIDDVFDNNKVNLLGMFDHYVYISRLLQKAEIEVNEEGTVAFAASGASLEDSIKPPVFRANKPFLYFIVDKPTRTVIISGKVSNPNTIK